MIKKFSIYLKNKKGLSLVETLTALSLLALIMFCFAPLMASYFKTIQISGEKIQTTYREAGILQKLIGNKGTGANSGYESNVSAIPLVFNVPETMVTKNGVQQKVDATSVAIGTQSGMANLLDPVKGNFIVSNPDNLAEGFSTIYTDSINSSIKCFPSTITDDFKTAYITIVADGFTFADDNLTGSKYAFYVTKAANGGSEASLVKLTHGVDYKLEKVKGSGDQILLLTLYGGTNISFENSPLVFNYNNGAYVKNIEIDAPTMMMVGEKAKDGSYYYYVSRGYVDEDGNLEIIRRKMNSVDHCGNNITLTSAMNDVEWVPAESADSYARDGENNPYGYYVMCGDNGQIRRFWRNNKTGNYYWGGDYTYYTDYNFVQVNDGGAAAFIRSTDAAGNASAGRVYSTDTSFKFISQRDMTNTQSGFNVGSKEYTVAGVANTSTILLRSLSVVSVTKADDAEFYGSDGRVVTYVLKKNASSVYPTYDQAMSMSGSWNGITIEDKPNLISIDQNNEIYGWFETNEDSYYEINGINPNSVNKNSYPITLTSVDSILITGDGGAHKKNVTDASEGSYYFTSTGDGDTSAEGATTNMNYPQETYTLYCGYIPAFMDLFAARTGTFGSYKYPTSWDKTFGYKADGTFYPVGDTYIPRADNRPTLENNAQYYAYWRMTLGITPYYNDGATSVKISPNGQLAYYKDYTSWFTKYHTYTIYWPYTNLEYAITGKFYDNDTFTNNKSLVQQNFGKNGARASVFTLGSPNHLINIYQGIQSNVTNGEVVDITISYLSHPFAIAVAANPTDDIVYDLSNNKDGNQVFYWNNRRETITFIDSASTVIPNGENDIPVSLMVGYVMGGTVEYSNDGGSAFANVGSVMNNGIVFLRSGNYNVAKQNSANSQTYEYLATDKDGYKLGAESNVFHQFYYLNSRTQKGYHGEDYQDPSKGGHIGNLYGAEYWQNNRHIQYKSLTGTTATDGADTATNYEYLRSHPMTNTKVTCVAWGTTWSGNPEAMWGTENGTVLSWWVDLSKASTDSNSSNWNDRSVDAEIQSYKWIDNCNNKTFALTSSQWKDTVGSAVFATTSTTGTSFYPGSANFKYFYDKGTQATSTYNTIGFVNTLETINDIAFANDTWVAVGDQSDVNPADYSAPGAMTVGNYSAGTQRTLQAFTDNGKGGSWINVRYWVDAAGTGVQSDDNATYHWKAVKISNNSNYNIVQINYVNGKWIATGYVDANNNDEFDDGEKTVICWAEDPLISCNDTAAAYKGWSEATVVWECQNGTFVDVTSQTGGINSVAVRS